MSTESELTRWAKVLDRILTAYDMTHSVARMLVESGKPVPNAQAWSVIDRVIFAPLRAAWEANPPAPGSALRGWIGPAYTAAIALDKTSNDAGPIADYIALVREARDMVQDALDGGADDNITIDSVLKDLELDVKLSVLAARLGHNGIMQLIDNRIHAENQAATREEAPPLPQLDLLSQEPVEQASYRTMSYAEIQSMADPGVMTAEEYRAGDELADRALILKYFASLWVTYMITQWDELYRPQLAELHGCGDTNDVVSEFFRELNMIRQDYAHHRGIATAKSAKNTRLAWFAEGDVMIPTPTNYDELLQELQSELTVLAQPPAPRDRPKTSGVKGAVPIELAKRFQEVAAANGIGVSAALEAALSKWIDEHDADGA